MESTATQQTTWCQKKGPEETRTGTGNADMCKDLGWQVPKSPNEQLQGEEHRGQTIQCPFCNIPNAVATKQCACGYYFVKEDYAKASHSVATDEVHKSNAGGDVAWGALWCIGGIAVTAITYSKAAPGGTYIVAWGAILFGAIQFFKGLANIQ